MTVLQGFPDSNRDEAAFPAGMQAILPRIARFPVPSQQMPHFPNDLPSRHKSVKSS
jgi:hypothetical protein